MQLNWEIKIQFIIPPFWCETRFSRGGASVMVGGHFGWGFVSKSCSRHVNSPRYKTPIQELNLYFAISIYVNS